MSRCFDLARLAGKDTKHNPQVGAVIIHNQKVIGEGYYKEFGGDHAEVNAINSVAQENKKYLKNSEIYVSLEPCCIHGKTPPCTGAIIRAGIPKVYISTLDPNTSINGRGVQLLKESGVDVIHGILEKEGHRLIAKFKANNIDKRPYVILKFAQTRDGFLGQSDHPVGITDIYSKTLSHKWRSEVESILIGTNTAVVDNPRLTNRLYSGSSPLRITVDMNERIPKSHNLLSDDLPCWIFTLNPNYITSGKNKIIHTIATAEELIDQIFKRLFSANVLSLIVEGGSMLLQSFIDTDNWDEARIFSAPKKLHEGIKAPNLIFRYTQKNQLMRDQVVTGFRTLG
jgi:diaminohydroxyphosphoribosylaminopyrimidine deaminase/5-amino-6-(5-phosphoribosylamino)uracil reductase